MAYHILNAQNVRDALKMMWYRLFDLIVVDENFDTDNPETNPVMKHLEDLNMSVRRNIYCGHDQQKVSYHGSDDSV
ncbi:MAG: hypothetical protein QGI64_06965 [Desulfobacterales bacterium]|jgi:hypothetical protein|nr:hypothetical protein [Desulfobacterales bacterium]